MRACSHERVWVLTIFLQFFAERSGLLAGVTLLTAGTSLRCAETKSWEQRHVKCWRLVVYLANLTDIADLGVMLFDAELHATLGIANTILLAESVGVASRGVKFKDNAI